MDKKYGLSQTEYEMMEFFWGAEEKLSFKEILNYFNEEKNKNWKKQTLSSFLKILQDKNLLRSDTEGKRYRYYAVTTKAEHIHLWIKQLFKESFGNSMSSFLVAFTGGGRLSKEEADELRAYLDQYETDKSEDEE